MQRKYKLLMTIQICPIEELLCKILQYSEEKFNNVPKDHPFSTYAKLSEKHLLPHETHSYVSVTVMIKCYFSESFCTYHCVKSVRIRSYSGLYFPTFELNTGKYGPEKLRIRTLFTQCNK